MRNILVTGAGGGIGGALVDEYARNGDRVFATARDVNSRQHLVESGEEYADTVTLIDLDVVDSTARLRARQDVLDETDQIDVLINAAGVNAARMDVPAEHVALEGLRADSMLEMFQVNAIAPILMVQAFLPELSRGSTAHVVNISSDMGSIERKTDGGNYSYAGSKAALNMMTRALAFEVQANGIVAVAVHPGWVKTDIGGYGGELSPEESASKLRHLEQDLSFDDTGAFLNSAGEPLPW